MNERELLHELIARESVTPADGGCLDSIGSLLGSAGFRIERLDSGEVSNLWATWGDENGLLVFAGHVDVVPPGSRGAWTSDPFVPAERDGRIYGRGACDMKGSVAAMTCAARDAAISGKLSTGGLGLLLTSDEEGDAIEGTDHVVKVLENRGVRLRHCLVGEPTSVRRMGDTAKNGRRGALNARIAIRGRQGHSAYPRQCDNAAHRMVRFLQELMEREWDSPGRKPEFAPTSFQVTDLHGGLGTTNVVPGEASAIIDIRFAPPDTPAELIQAVENLLRDGNADCTCEWSRPAAPYFVDSDTQLAQALSAAIEKHAGHRPQFSTAGGTSDARFLHRISGELLEFGPVSDSMHQADEHIGVEELAQSKQIYEELIYKLLGG